MFSENLKTLRKEKGLSQEELASQLHIVRQTVSKWEKALSVPDAQLLINLAEILEVPVSTLLGEKIEPSAEKNVLAEQLERLNAQLMERTNRSRRTWRIVLIGILAILCIIVITMIFSAAA
ncbi:MAG: helix-turn-helix domain-containing protein [Christensenellaceae bacterium]